MKWKKKLVKAWKYLTELYHGEILGTLIGQATDRAGCYRKVNHGKLSVGDIVLVKEVNCKRSSYPLAIVTEITTNDMGETTNVLVRKGSTGGTLKRHVESLIPLLSCHDPVPDCALAPPDAGSSDGVGGGVR